MTIALQTTETQTDSKGIIMDYGFSRKYKLSFKCRNRRVRDKRLQHRREEERECRALESEEMREVRLSKQRAGDRTRRASLSGSGQLISSKEIKIQRQHARLASEEPEQRESRLQRMTANQQKRLPAETDEERDTGLQRLRANQHYRLAAETNDDRETKLQQLRVNQQDRLAAETNDDRETRL